MKEELIRIARAIVNKEREAWVECVKCAFIIIATIIACAAYLAATPDSVNGDGETEMEVR